MTHNALAFFNPRRAGYVPNVVYTCGAMRHKQRIILPYAVSDTFSNFSTLKIEARLQSLEKTT